MENAKNANPKRIIEIRWFFPQTPILVYHDVIPSGLPTDGSGNSTKESRFEQQMRYLHENNYHCIKLSDFLQFPNYKQHKLKKSFVLTFDDGLEDLHSLALPILIKYGFTATISLITNLIGTVSKSGDKRNPLFLSWDQIGIINSQGFTFASHTCTHTNLVNLSDKEIRYELSASKDCLEARLNQKIPYLVYPYGRSNDHIRQLARQAGYEAALGVNTGEPGLFNLSRCDIGSQNSMVTFKMKMTPGYLYARWLKRWGREKTVLGLFLKRFPQLKHSS